MGPPVPIHVRSGRHERLLLTLHLFGQTIHFEADTANSVFCRLLSLPRPHKYLTFPTFGMVSAIERIGQVEKNAPWIDKSFLYSNHAAHSVPLLSSLSSYVNGIRNLAQTHEAKRMAVESTKKQTKPNPIQFDEFAFFKLTNHYVRFFAQKSEENSKIPFSSIPCYSINTVCPLCGNAYLYVADCWLDNDEPPQRPFIFLFDKLRAKCPSLSPHAFIFKWKIYFIFLFWHFTWLFVKCSLLVLIR